MNLTRGVSSTRFTPRSASARCAVCRGASVAGAPPNTAIAARTFSGVMAPWNVSPPVLWAASSAASAFPAPDSVGMRMSFT